MSVSSFKEFVANRKTETDEVRSIDWESRKVWYLKQVEELFKKIRGYLAEFKDDIQVTEGTETISEDFIGEYEVPILKINLYGKHASVVPAGINLIGTPGRVDLVSYVERVRIILGDKNRRSPASIYRNLTEEDHALTDYVWKIITESPRRQYVEVEKECFLEALQEVLGG